MPLQLIRDESSPIEIPASPQTSRAQGEPAELPSDSQSPSQVEVRGDNGPTHVANQLSDRVARAKLDPWQRGDLLRRIKGARTTVR